MSINLLIGRKKNTQYSNMVNRNIDYSNSYFLLFN